MDISKLAEKYEKKLKITEQNVLDWESSDNHELRIASRTIKCEAEELRIIVDALRKQNPMMATYEYDDEFVCPACGYENEYYDVTTLTLCPKCGQKLKWE